MKTTFFFPDACLRSFLGHAIVLAHPKSLANYETLNNVAVSIRATFSGGIEGAAEAGATFYGTEDSVSKVVNDHVSTILDKGVIPAHVAGCWKLCLGAGYDIDPSKIDIMKGSDRSVSYFIGGGYGIDIGLNLAEASDWVIYDPKGGKPRIQIPINFPDYFREARDDFRVLKTRIKDRLRNLFRLDFLSKIKD